MLTQKEMLRVCYHRTLNHVQLNLLPEDTNFIQRNRPMVVKGILPTNSGKCQSSGGSKGSARDAPPGGPNSFNFMQFLGNFCKIVCWRPPLRSWRPLLGEILDPELILVGHCNNLLTVKGVVAQRSVPTKRSYCVSFWTLHTGTVMELWLQGETRWPIRLVDIYPLSLWCPSLMLQKCLLTGQLTNLTALKQSEVWIFRPN